MTTMNKKRMVYVNVDIIVPVHNATNTIVSTIHSAMNQLYFCSCCCFCNNNNNHNHNNNEYKNNSCRGSKDATSSSSTETIRCRESTGRSSDSLKRQKQESNIDEEYKLFNLQQNDDNNIENVYENNPYRDNNQQEHANNPQQLQQQPPQNVKYDVDITIYVCCYDDASTDNSWEVLQKLKHVYDNKERPKLNDERINLKQQSGGFGGGDGDSGSCGTNDNKYGNNNIQQIPSYLCIETSTDGINRGAGYARNGAVAMRSGSYNSSRKDNDNDHACEHCTYDKYDERFLCFLDSDDTMHPTRVIQQVQYFLNIKYGNDTSGNSSTNSIDGSNILLGCNFNRDPIDATWHYTKWANEWMTNERIVLECFREITIIQPTWMLYRSRFEQLGGYIEIPSSSSSTTTTTTSTELTMQQIIEHNRSIRRKAMKNKTTISANTGTNTFKENDKVDYAYDNNEDTDNSCLLMIHPKFDTIQSVRIAEDLRFFYTHLSTTTSTGTAGSNHGTIHLLRTHVPLVTYKHHQNQTSQSKQTSRKLLLQLRTMAFEACILNKIWNNFILGSTSSPTMTSTTTSTTMQQQQTVPTDVSNDNISTTTTTNQFVVWGGGRDGKDFIKSLDCTTQQRIYCIVDVDDKKIQQGYYVNHELNIKIPIVHYSLLTRRKHNKTTTTVTSTTNHHSNSNDTNINTISNNDNSLLPTSHSGNNNQVVVDSFGVFGKIDKKRRHDQESCNSTTITSKSSIAATTAKTTTTTTNESYGTKDEPTNTKTPATIGNGKSSSIDYSKSPGCHNLNLHLLPYLPVVVCVAMYRTGGALEHNVQSIGRTEGYDLWHII